MLDGYFTGAVGELIERARWLKAKVPRNLRRRDYDALRRICDDRLTDAIRRLREILDEPAYRKPEFRAQRLRAFRRIVAELDNVESFGIAALERADHADPFLNDLLDRIAKEIRFPHSTPIVATLSQRYFYVISELNLLCVPLAEGDFLLHLPDLYHELAHPLLLVADDPVIEPFQAAHLKGLGTSYDYLNGEIEKERGYGPKQNVPLLRAWQANYVKSWTTEFFCDGFAAATLGPAFAWAHLHLCAKRGGNLFEAATTATSHPAEDARMVLVLKVLSQLGHMKAAAEVQARWNDLIDESGYRAEPEYRRCYPEPLLADLARFCVEGVEKIGCRLADADSDGDVHVLLNEAWETFWKTPIDYSAWERKALNALRRTVKATGN
jgi:hypothetical protein